MSPPDRDAIANVGNLASRCGVRLDRAARDRLAGFLELTMTWGRRIDLTSARDPIKLAEILFVDAFEILAGDLIPPDAHVVDVGAGVGAPTIPLALVRGDVRATLVEPRRKRVAFLRTAVGTFELAQRVRVVEGKLDPARPATLVETHGPFDVALSRATFAPTAWRRLGAELAPRTLVFTAQEEPPGRPGSTRPYAVPSTGAKRALSSYDER